MNENEGNYRYTVTLVPKLAWRYIVERRQGDAWRPCWEGYRCTLSAATEDAEDAIRLDKRLAATCETLGIDGDNVTIGEVAI